MSVENYAAQNLKELRAASKLSRRAVVDKLEIEGVHLQETSLKRIEDGKQSVKIEEAVAFSRIFSVDLEQFITEPVNLELAEINSLSTAISDDVVALLGAATRIESASDALGDKLALISGPHALAPDVDYARDLIKELEIISSIREVVARAAKHMAIKEPYDGSR
ncbi:hypothetical protein CBE89_02980 [Corynebacterium striatum]|uniref:HTH cro/C1-type domain-containing protein n=1 Tax=Corynebacterium striatum TaxID=43770 RepID=A0A2Z2J2F1_CORST|nr:MULTISPECIES: helix-turn-helix transcriptional regulator [Corynebacterium]ART20577.1 hypothetical protein CBE89_02980 [Corynebacterium striatum]MCK6161407.1 helix-turn-helix transcriptional regulator [Corynebacterium simulans]HCG3140084.1 helix-turn-helix transcriptional regulator [Corynebacterium striatum]